MKQDAQHLRAARERLAASRTRAELEAQLRRAEVYAACPEIEQVDKAVKQLGQGLMLSAISLHSREDKAAFNARIDAQKANIDALLSDRAELLRAAYQQHARRSARPVRRIHPASPPSSLHGTHLSLCKRNFCSILPASTVIVNNFLCSLLFILLNPAFRISNTGNPEKGIDNGRRCAYNAPIQTVRVFLIPGSHGNIKTAMASCRRVLCASLPFFIFEV